LHWHFRAIKYPEVMFRPILWNWVMTLFINLQPIDEVAHLMANIISMSDGAVLRLVALEALRSLDKHADAIMDVKVHDLLYRKLQSWNDPEKWYNKVVEQDWLLARDVCEKILPAVDAEKLIRCASFSTDASTTDASFSTDASEMDCVLMYSGVALDESQLPSCCTWHMNVASTLFSVYCTMSFAIDFVRRLKSNSPGAVVGIVPKPVATQILEQMHRQLEEERVAHKQRGLNVRAARLEAGVALPDWGDSVAEEELPCDKPPQVQDDWGDSVAEEELPRDKPPQVKDVSNPKKQPHLSPVSPDGSRARRPKRSRWVPESATPTGTPVKEMTDRILGLLAARDAFVGQYVLGVETSKVELCELLVSKKPLTRGNLATFCGVSAQRKGFFNTALSTVVSSHQSLAESHLDSQLLSSLSSTRSPSSGSICKQSRTGAANYGDSQPAFGVPISWRQ